MLRDDDGVQDDKKACRVCCACQDSRLTHVWPLHTALVHCVFSARGVSSDLVECVHRPA